jgi:hypothetical protein
MRLARRALRWHRSVACVAGMARRMRSCTSAGSSCSFTSASDDDVTTDQQHRRRRPQQLCRRTSATFSAYEVWISEPTSVEERHRVLLRRLGLISDSDPRPSPRLSSPRLVALIQWNEDVRACLA